MIYYTFFQLFLQVFDKNKMSAERCYVCIFTDLVLNLFQIWIVRSLKSYVMSILLRISVPIGTEEF